MAHTTHQPLPPHAVSAIDASRAPRATRLAGRSGGTIGGPWYGNVFVRVESGKDLLNSRAGLAVVCSGPAIAAPRIGAGTI